jgi:multidrug efflux pump subunit AcrA (membrane-fusion protein)
MARALRLMSLQRWISVPLICGALGMVGCAGKPPLANLSQAELAVQEADKKTASQYAPLELQTAREQLGDAKRAMDDKEYDTARRLADQALVNAQLAEAKAGAEKARQAAAALQRSIQTLRTELQRTPTR